MQFLTAIKNGVPEYFVHFTDPLLGPLTCNLEEAFSPNEAVNGRNPLDNLVPIEAHNVPGKVRNALLEVVQLSTVVE